ncbi:MAG: hypothetical protein C0596_15900 [Marinilabiliales bacterium]|nr:MAG: hypothetical protein C0596_15900 [Marinilabiliales bacterium]
MKSKINLLLIAGISLMVYLSSCSTNMLTMSVKEPALVDIPNDVKKVGIINRSLPGEKTEKLDDADKILSLEGKDFDKNGAERMINGCFNELIAMEVYDEIKIIEDSTLRSPGLGVYPASLTWEEVERLCNDNGVDIIYVLSFYDTDTKAEYHSSKEGSVGIGDLAVPVIKHHATVYTNIKSGWRIYDPVNKLILDEFISHQSVVSKGSGINPLKAVEAIKGRTEAVMEASSYLGIAYAQRILPYYIRVRRDYYVKGSNNFKIGKRRAQTGDWDGAAEMWEKELDSPKRKVAGRACYNMAIINEINGDLDAALEWASKSYTDYRIKKALDYVNILKYRINQRAVLEQQ